MHMRAEQPRRVLSDERFSPDDFQRRWLAARIAALRSVTGEAAADVEAADEIGLLSRVPDAERDTVLRRVFDNSRKLGISVVRFLGLSWEVTDIAEVLGRCPTPCLGGRWSRTRTATVLERAGCEPVKAVGSFYCDYWREAVDGLVMGVGETERFARHASAGHGDPSCVDVFFDDSLDHAGARPRHGMVPEKILLGLSGIKTRLERMKATLTFEGLSEGVLYYRLESSEGPLCGASGRLLHESITREAKNLFPGLLLKDASPLAVYGEGTK